MIFNKIKKAFLINNSTALKFLEMFQYTVVVLSLSLVVALIYHKLFRIFTVRGDSFLVLFINLIIDTYLICIAIFYIKKFALLVPSISKMINPAFKAHTTFGEYTIHLAAFVALIELLPFYYDHYHKLHYKLGIL